MMVFGPNMRLLPNDFVTGPILKLQSHCSHQNSTASSGNSISCAVPLAVWAPLAMADKSDTRLSATDNSLAIFCFWINEKNVIRIIPPAIMINTQLTGTSSCPFRLFTSDVTLIYSFFLCQHICGSL